MMKIATKTRLSPEETVRRAVDFFGPGGHGLKVTAQSPDCASFEGGGGGVEVSACIEGKETAVELTSREWDYQVKEFVGKIQ